MKTKSTDVVKSVRPPLKWAGGKFKLLSQITAKLPNENRLIEPFVGSGVLFLNTNYKSYLLNDKNEHLIDFYKYVKKEGAEFIKYAKRYFADRYNDPDEYYRLRDKFNTTTDPRMKAALFLYINKHGFNGLCRFNSKGECNVPVGRYKKTYYPENELLLFSKKLKKAKLSSKDFESVMRQAKPGDAIYCDPPYVPLSSTANFTAYSAGGFSTEDQIRLAALAKEISETGVTVVISNHNTDFTREIYGDAVSEVFSVQRTISCDGNNRRKAKELIAIYG